MIEFLRRAPRNFTLSEDDKANQPEIPDNLWVKCPQCNELLYTREFEKLLKVCHKCGHHFRLTATERIQVLLDEGSFVEEGADIEPGDPLEFVSEGQPYEAKLHSTQRKTGLNEAIVYGSGAIEGHKTVLAVAEFGFLGASMGSVYGEKISRAATLALRQKSPLVIVSSSGGARMHEGIFSLMQMAKTTAALVELGEAKLPFISLLADPCFGGVTASYALLADVMIAEPGALIGFAGPRVIEQTIRQKLPSGFQTAEFLLKHGFVDMVVPRRDLRATMARLLRLY